jgi:GTP cyclohydrolase IA
MIHEDEQDTAECRAVEQELAGHVLGIIKALGVDPERAGLAETPVRVARSLRFFTSGYAHNVRHLVGDAVFDHAGDELVLVSHIRFSSLCEHHLLPFTGEAHVAYLPNGRVIGLSKIPRIVEMYARRLQIQERLTREIADAMEEVLAPYGVGVVLVADHACMSMRGVEQPTTRTVTRCLRGALRTDPTARAELLSLLRYS